MQITIFLFVDSSDSASPFPCRSTLLAGTTHTPPTVSKGFKDEMEQQRIRTLKKGWQVFPSTGLIDALKPTWSLKLVISLNFFLYQLPAKVLHFSLLWYSTSESKERSRKFQWNAEFWFYLALAPLRSQKCESNAFTTSLQTTLTTSMWLSLCRSCLATSQKSSDSSWYSRPSSLLRCPYQDRM